eukprot:TRINITY_DN13215_c0_g1_i1.p1 TRINITY_DN13215_c0_g1~~TRINITY_DN13215_c0_g1_i1.p1  ORF type:complete len:389 (-),score=74.25 TRINITY_DN13215_c0_g1_i1:106-1272(-)
MIKCYPLIHIILLFSIFSLVLCHDHHDDEVASNCTESKYNPFLRFVWDLPSNITDQLKDISESALLVIDMQKDFTFGSFGLPCYNDTPQFYTLPTRIADMIKYFVDNDGYVVASKDWHPQDHCSFINTTEPPCFNNDTMGQIYQNSFPPHCVHNNVSGNPTWSEGYRGADFVPEIASAMTDAISKGKGNVVFKGFNPNWESFSAFSMANESPEEALYTGGWTPNTPYVPSDSNPIDNYYPTVDDMLNVQSNMISLADTLKNQGIKQIFVSGLVFDYCVRDTSIYGLLPENMGSEIDMLVVVDLSRPAMDGTTAQVQIGNFLLGSSERIVSQAGWMLNNNVRFIKSETIYNNTENDTVKRSSEHPSAREEDEEYSRISEAFMGPKMIMV